MGVRLGPGLHRAHRGPTVSKSGSGPLYGSSYWVLVGMLLFGSAYRADKRLVWICLSTCSKFPLSPLPRAHFALVL